MTKKIDDKPIHIVPDKYQKSMDVDLKIRERIEKEYNRRFAWGLGKMKKRLQIGLQRKAELAYREAINDEAHQREAVERREAMNRAVREKYLSNISK